MSETTIDFLDLEALALEVAYADPGRWSHCELGAAVEVRAAPIVGRLLSRWKRRTQVEGACRHPTAGVIRITCSQDGVARKALCRMHLDRLRLPGVVVTCPTCEAPGVWAS